MLNTAINKPAQSFAAGFLAMCAVSFLFAEVATSKDFELAVKPLLPVSCVTNVAREKPVCLTVPPDRIAIPTELPGYTHIMCVGDSITYGCDESRSLWANMNRPYGGYKPMLYRLLTASGQKVQFVGSVDSGTGTVNRWRFCEGLPGWNSTQIANRFAPSYKPMAADIYLVEVGTNDKGTSVRPAHSRMNNIRLWSELLAVNPRAKVYVASIPPSRMTRFNAWAVNYNAMLKSAVSDANDPRIRFVDLHANAGLCPSDFGTKIGLHPTPAGYAKIARFWASVLR